MTVTAAGWSRNLRKRPPHPRNLSQLFTPRGDKCDKFGGFRRLGRRFR